MQETYTVKKIVLKNKAYLVYFNDEEAIILNEDQIVEHRIIVGSIFTKNDYQKIKKSAQITKYYNKTLHYIDFKPRTKKEVEDYLAKCELNKSDIDKIIKKLITIKYLDDERYAKSYVSEGMRKGKGRNYLFQQLQNKGLDKKMIETSLEAYELVDERANALKMATKMLNIVKKYPLKKQQILITNHLLQDGFNYDIINDLPIYEIYIWGYNFKKEKQYGDEYDE